MIPLRDTTRSYTTPFVTMLLIAANALAFLYELSAGRFLPQLIDGLGFVPARFFFWSEMGGVALDPWRFAPLLTAQFLHGGWAHIIGNMWFLWIFGDNVEDRLGHGRFFLFYLLAGGAAFLVHGFFDPTSALPVVGASGAIAGVLGAYLVLYPWSRILTLVPIFFIPWFVEVPAVVFIGIWFLLQLFNGTLALAAAAGQTTGIAWWAHAGGFIAGIALLAFFRGRARPRHPPWAGP